MALLDDVKVALGVSSSYYDNTLLDVIMSAQEDMTDRGIDIAMLPAVVKNAIITYCRGYFGTDSDAERYQESYELQVKKLMMQRGHSNE